MSDLCGCGCGEQVRPGRRFLRGHWSRTKERKTYGFREEDHGYETLCHVHDGPLVMGYGWERRNYTHRLAFLDRGIEIPKGWEPDHLCEVKACKRFDHLELVPGRENRRRAWSRHPERKPAGCYAGGYDPRHNTAKTHCPQGHPYDEANTILKPGREQGKFRRVCRECARLYAQRKRDEAKLRLQP